MSDDTPTQRLPEDPTPWQVSPDAPTQRLPEAAGPDAPTQIMPDGLMPQNPAAPGASMPAAHVPLMPLASEAPTTAFEPTPRVAAPAAPELEQPRRSRLFIVLITIAVVLLAAILGLLIWLAATDSSPQAAPVETNATETPEPTETPTETNEPDPTPTETAPPLPSGPPPGSVLSYTSSTTAVDCTGVTSVPVTFSWDTTGESVTFSIGALEAENGPYETGLGATDSITVDYQCGRDEGEQIYTIAVYFGGEVVGRGDLTLWDE